MRAAIIEPLALCTLRPVNKPDYSGPQSKAEQSALCIFRRMDIKRRTVWTRGHKTNVVREG